MISNYLQLLLIIIYVHLKKVPEEKLHLRLASSENSDTP